MANNTPRRNHNIEDLENAFQKLANKRNPPKGGRYAKTRDDKTITILIIAISAVLILGIIGAIVLFNSSSDNTIISQNINILGIDLKGMSSNKAKNSINQAFSEKYGNQSITVEIENISVKVKSSELSAKLDVDRIVSDILSNAYNDNLVSYLVLDDSIVLQKITACIPPITSPLVPSTYTIEGTKPETFDKIDDSVSVALHITKGTPGKSLGEDALIQAIKEAFWSHEKSIVYVCPVSEPEVLDFEAISMEACILPVDAQFDKETGKIIGGTLGFMFDVEDATDALSNAEYGETVQIPFQWVEPEHTLEELQESLFRDQLATYTTRAGWDSDRNVNLRLACEAINGLVMNPGDTFSYNETLGQRTPEKGYRPGASYVGGETVYDYGGGICQVSSTLYYCTVVSDLEIIERDCHGYASSYIPLSMDATVFWGGIDFKFRNNSEYPIRIDAKADGGNVTVSIMGTDYKDYTVKFEYEHIDTYPFEVIYKEMKEDNEKGFKDGDVITGAYTGYKSKGYKALYDKETGELIDRILLSTDVYSKRDRVICKIIKEETEPSEPVPSDPSEPTEPDNTTENLPDESTTQAPETEPDPPESSAQDPTQSNPVE